MIETILKQLEALGTIDAKVLHKIRQQVDNHGKPVKPQAILKYLVSKGFIDERQASDLLSQTTQIADPDEALDNPPISATDSPGGGVNDEDELMATFMQPKQPPAEPPAAATTDQRKEVASDRGDSEKESQSEGKLAEAKQSSAEKSRSKSKRSRKRRATQVDPIRETMLDPDQLERPFGGDIAANPFADGMNDPAIGVGGFSDLDDVANATPSSVLPTFRGKRDKRNQWATKWLFIGSTIVGLLLVFGGVLAIATIGIGADERYKLAVESMKNLAYLDAAKRFEEFIEMHPRHKNIPLAKANYAEAIIRAEYQTGGYERAIRRADDLLPAIIDDPLGRIDDLRDDIALVLPRSLAQITEAATKLTDVNAMQEELTRILELQQIVDNNEYIPTSFRRQTITADYLSKIDNDIRILRSQIEKENQYSAAIVQIESLGRQAKTNEAFAVYRQLTRNYGDLAGREELRKAMAEVSEQERNLVIPLEEKFAVSNQPRDSAVRHTYLLTRIGDQVVESLNDEFVSFLVDGSVYTLRAGDGEILWKKFVGYQTSIQPELIDSQVLLVSDLNNFDLMLLEQRTGNLIWRLEIGESFLQPVVSDAMIAVTTRSGKVLKISRETGDVDQAIRLPQPANVPAMIAEREPYLYQVGTHSNLYVLSQQDLSCREVIYLGHEKGSIAVPAAYWSGYILIALNRGNHSDLWVFKSQENGLQLELVQVINRIADSYISTPIKRYSRWVLLSGDQGDIRILELKTGDDPIPVTRFASDRFENRGARTFLLTEGNNIWIAGNDLSRVKFQRTQGLFNRELVTNSGDSFLAPLAKLDDYVVHVRRRKDSGMLSVSLVDGISLRPVWRTDFAGQLPAPPAVTDDHLKLISNQGDYFEIKPGEDQVAITPVAISSPIVETLKFPYAITLSSGLTALGMPGQNEMLFVRGNRSNLFPLQPPANRPACRPLAIGDHLIVASLDGPVVRIKPDSGQVVGTPFMPPIAANEQTTWFEPTRLDDHRMAIARGTDHSGQNWLYVLGTSDPEVLEELNALESNLPFKSNLVNNGQHLFAIAEGENGDVLMGIEFIDQLGIELQVELPGRAVDGPWLVNERILLRMDNDQLLMFDRALVERWSLSMPTTGLAGEPGIWENDLLICFQDGELQLVDFETGELQRRYQLGHPISSSIIQMNQRTYVGGADGSVHEVVLTDLGG